MVDSLEVQEFDYLEQALLEASVPFSEITRQCARYLLSLIDGGVLASVSAPKLKVLIPYIEKSIQRELIESDGDLRKRLALGVVSRKPRNFRQPINMACLALGR